MTFQEDTMDIIGLKNDTFWYTIQNPETKKYEVNLLKIALEEGIEGGIQASSQRLIESEDAFAAYLLRKGWLMLHNDSGSFRYSYYSFEGDVLWKSKNLAYSIMYRLFPLIYKKNSLYEIREDRNTGGQIARMRVYVCVEEGERGIHFKATNAVSSHFISDLISADQDPAKILGVKTHQNFFDAVGTWVFFDKKFEQSIQILKEKINKTYDFLKNHNWDFQDIPHPVEDKYQLQDVKKGTIVFRDDRFLDTAYEQPLELACDSEGNVDIPENFLSIALPSLEEMLCHDKNNFPIRYGIFRRSENPAPTIMIVSGGPDVLLDYKHFEDYIYFFTNNGFHIVIPEGLLRGGGTMDYARYSQGELGKKDLEHLKCIIRDLNTKNISSGKVCVMGHSYGGYCAARLAEDDELIQAAVIEAAMLDLHALLLLEPSLLPFVDKDTKRFVENPIALNDLWKDLEEITPSLRDPLPQTPIFVSCATNDARCSIKHTRHYVERVLREHKEPKLIYVEHEGGGHAHTIDDLKILFNFFTGIFGQNTINDMEGCRLVHDTMSFFGNSEKE